jgi:hypothetical protein
MTRIFAGSLGRDLVAAMQRVGEGIAAFTNCSDTELMQ